MLMLFLLAAMAAADTAPVDTGFIDWKLTRIAEGIARDGGLDVFIMVKTPPRWRELGIVNAWTSRQGKFITILVSPILVDEMDQEGMRGLLGHELGHTPRRCMGPYKSDAAELACEGAADAWSVRAVGYETSVKGLCQYMTIAFDYRYSTDVSPFIDRVRLLHRRFR